MFRCPQCLEEKPTTDFYPSQRRNGSWCKSCFIRWHRERAGPSPEPRPCEWCGKMIEHPTKHKQRFCSANCKQRELYLRTHPKVERPCQNCGIDISHRRNDAKWCSDSCRELLRRKRLGPEGRRATKLKVYGLTIEGYEALLVAQGGGCAICGREVHRGNDPRKLHVDHDHATGRVRGILCANCNNVLGHAADDPELLTRAIEYLRAYA